MSMTEMTVPTMDIEKASSRDESDQLSLPTGEGEAPSSSVLVASHADNDDDRKAEGAQGDDEEAQEEKINDSFDVGDVSLPMMVARQEAVSTTRKNMKLSVTSQMYDRGNKGYLDDTEKKLREMDTDNQGHLDVDKVYALMQILQAEQRKALNLKRVVIALSVFALLLALTNIGTSFAAAKLAKDTSVNDQGLMMVKGTNFVAGTPERTLIFYAEPDDEPIEVANATDSSGRNLAVQLANSAINFNQFDGLYKEVCNNWGTSNVLRVKNYDGRTLQCGSTGRVEVEFCNIVTELRYKQLPFINNAGKKIFKFNARRGNANVGTVTYTCNPANNKCNTANLPCGTECSKWFQFGSDIRELSWRCPASEKCGCNPCHEDRDQSGNLKAQVGCAASLTSCTSSIQNGEQFEQCL